jgi:predicted nucleic acid-binding protein
MVLPSTTTISTERQSNRSNLRCRAPFSRTHSTGSLFISPRDAFHAAVLSFSRTLWSIRLLTTDEVLAEVLNHFARLGPYWRAKAAALVANVRSDPNVAVLPQTRSDFDAALALFQARPDKGYSLTDCRSMLAMKGLGLTEVLSNDHHFTQEGLTILFPTP